MGKQGGRKGGHRELWQRGSPLKLKAWEGLIMSFFWTEDGDGPHEKKYSLLPGTEWPLTDSDEMGDWVLQSQGTEFSQQPL